MQSQFLVERHRNSIRRGISPPLRSSSRSESSFPPESASLNAQTFPIGSQSAVLCRSVYISMRPGRSGIQDLCSNDYYSLPSSVPSSFTQQGPVYPQNSSPSRLPFENLVQHAALEAFLHLDLYDKDKGKSSMDFVHDFLLSSRGVLQGVHHKTDETLSAVLCSHAERVKPPLCEPPLKYFAQAALQYNETEWQHYDRIITSVHLDLICNRQAILMCEEYRDCSLCRAYKEALKKRTLKV